MTLYLDTSVIVSALTHEVATPGVHAWLASVSDQPLAISDWVVTEFASALSLKQRTGQISEALRLEAQVEFERLRMASLLVLAISSRHFQLAAEIINERKISLRSGDALHAAVAQERGLTLCTRDNALARDCAALGIACLQL